MGGNYAIRQIDTSKHEGFTPDPIPTSGDFGSPDVRVNDYRAWRIGDKWATHIDTTPDPDVVHKDTDTSKQQTGSTTVFVNGIGMAYKGILSCGASNTSSSEDVFVGP